MNPTSLNYNINACYDDGSCIIPVLGCTDVSAFNYNPLANTTNPTACLYEAVGCVTGLGYDPIVSPNGTGYWLNDGCFAWVIDISPSCCNNEWNGGCQTLYNYCEENDPSVGIEEYGQYMISVYPNPTNNFITIETDMTVTICT